MLHRIVAICLLAASGTVRAERISWFSGAGAVNHTSASLPMDAGFRFELGVFEGSFIPSSSNKELWAQHWRPAMRTAYDASAKAFNDLHEVWDNLTPFTVGKPAYIWGFRGDALAGEWILFRAPSWTWPVVNPLNPEPPTWNAALATPVLGQINAAGTPFLMKSAAVTGAAPPTTSWQQWRDEQLTGELLDEPGDDPDHDGTPNLLEFVFGTLPQTANPPVPTPASLVSGHVTITIPRRVDHAVLLTVEVSGNLTNWQSGPGHTETVSDTVTALVVRDLTPLDSANPKRFIRLRAVLP
jgi:hypothetical protein